tara:strand:- start:400 stop:615 length:216 start_codon:yes stop_codon:yes gene_type:complete
MKHYYTLFVYDTENQAWHNEFGDYTRDSILEEIDCSYYYTKKKHLKIIKNDGSITATLAACEWLNRESTNA